MNNKNDALNLNLDPSSSESKDKDVEMNENPIIDFTSFKNIVLSLMEMHDPILKDHGERVAKLSKRLAVAIECSSTLVNQIEIAALFHDIGKISLPSSLIIKTAPELTSSQRKQYQKHPTLGSELLKIIPEFDEIALIILHHHETISGTGFPDKLSDDDIPLGSRIVAIANYYDHCLYPHGKEKTGSKHQAIRAMEVAADIHLDKPLVEIFLEVAISKKSDSVIEITSKHLLPGMKLAYDISNVIGDALLTSETVLTEATISSFREVEKQRIKIGIKPPTGRIYIHKSSIPNDILEDAGKLSTSENKTEAAALETKENEVEADKPANNENNIIPSQGTKPTDLESNPKKSKPDRPLILVVDDEQHVVNALKRELRRAGYDVEGFTKALDALRYIRTNNKVYALITDLKMPGITGDQFLVHLQKEFPKLPCIVITGQATQDTVLKLLKSTRITRLLPKPWNKDTLLNTLEELNKE